MSMKDEILTKIGQALTKGDRNAVGKLTKEALDKGLDVKTILEDGLIASMYAIGEKFKNNEIFIPEVLIAAKAMHFARKLFPRPVLPMNKTSFFCEIKVTSIRSRILVFCFFREM